MKIKLAIVTLATVAASVFGQGVVDFRNSGVTFTTTADRFVRGMDGTPLGGTNFLAQLYWSTDTGLLGSKNTGVGTAAGISNAVATIHNPVTFRVTTSSSVGTWLINPATDYKRTVGWNIGESGVLQVRVWDGGAGGATSFADSQISGASDWFSYTVPVAGAPVSAYYMDNLRGFTLVPEPSIIGLGILGAIAGLFVFRRRN